MKRKIVIGSIGAALIFILASCSSVIGADTDEINDLSEPKIEEILNLVKEKINRVGSLNPDDPQTSCVLYVFFCLLETAIVLLICYILVLIFGPGPGPF